MARYRQNIPEALKNEARRIAERQGVSLNQLILWSVAEKVAELRQAMTDPRFPLVSYRMGASGVPTAVVAGTGVRVQTLHIAATHWGRTPAEIAEDYRLSKELVTQALAFAQAHRREIEAAIAEEEELEAQACRS